jgi:hypothetical protein
VREDRSIAVAVSSTTGHGVGHGLSDPQLRLRSRREAISYLPKSAAILASRVAQGLLFTRTMIPSRKCEDGEIAVLWDDLDAEQTCTTLFVPGEEHQKFSGTFGAARPASRPNDPIVLTDADFETVRFVPSESDPCRAFARLFAEERIETIARPVRRVHRFPPPLAIDPMAATLSVLPRDSRPTPVPPSGARPTPVPPSGSRPIARPAPVALPRPAPVTWQRPSASASPSPRRAQATSLIPWATLAMTLVVVAGLFADEIKAGTLGDLVEVVASFVDPGQKPR